MQLATLSVNMLAVRQHDNALFEGMYKQPVLVSGVSSQLDHAIMICPHLFPSSVGQWKPAEFSQHDCSACGLRRFKNTVQEVDVQLFCFFAICF